MRTIIIVPSLEKSGNAISSYCVHIYSRQCIKSKFINEHSWLKASSSLVVRGKQSAKNRLFIMLDPDRINGKVKRLNLTHIRTVYIENNEATISYKQYEICL